MSKKELIVQHNVLTTARYEMTAMEKDIFYMLFVQLEEEDPASKVYTVRVRELENRIQKKLNYCQFKAASAKLSKQVYFVLKEGKPFQLKILSYVSYKEKEGIVKLVLSKDMRPYLFQLKQHFTTLRIQVALQLRSTFSKRIYEMISQYKDTGIVKLSVKELKYRLGLIDPQTGKEQYEKFGLFKKRVLDTAKNELANQPETDLVFDYTCKKTGRKFTDLTFTISTKKLRITRKERPSETQKIFERLKKNKLADWQIEKIIAAVPEKEIGKILYEIKLLEINGKIQNLGGYTAKLFDTSYKLDLFKT